MKIKGDFVTNSSSTSYIIGKGVDCNIPPDGKVKLQIFVQVEKVFETEEDVNNYEFDYVETEETALELVRKGSHAVLFSEYDDLLKSEIENGTIVIDKINKNKGGDL